MADIDLLELCKSNKSDQLNGSDLWLDRTAILKITDVVKTGKQDQKLAVHYEGDAGRPWKPCVTMIRALTGAWRGVPSSQYIGRRVKLWRDPEVKYGDDKVGGLRISNVSDIKKRVILVLPSSRGRSKPYIIDPLPDDEVSEIDFSAGHPGTSPVAASETIDIRALQDQGLEIAERGLLELNAWWKSIGAKGQQALGLVVKEQLKDNAKAADEKAEKEDARLAAVAAASVVLPEGLKFEDGEVTEDRDGATAEVRDDG